MKHLIVSFGSPLIAKLFDSITIYYDEVEWMEFVEYNYKSSCFIKENEVIEEFISACFKIFFNFIKSNSSFRLCSVLEVLTKEEDVYLYCLT